MFACAGCQKQIGRFRLSLSCNGTRQSSWCPVPAGQSREQCTQGRCKVAKVSAEQFGRTWPALGDASHLLAEHLPHWCGSGRNNSMREKLPATPTLLRAAFSVLREIRNGPRQWEDNEMFTYSLRSHSLRHYTVINK